MAKLLKDLFGAANGDVYARTFLAGTECPTELEAAALETGAIKRTKADRVAAEEAAQVEAAAAAQAEADAAAQAEADAAAQAASGAA